jgi:hypothetical protein
MIEFQYFIRFFVRYYFLGKIAVFDLLIYEITSVIKIGIIVLLS